MPLTSLTTRSLSIDPLVVALTATFIVTASQAVPIGTTVLWFGLAVLYMASAIYLDAFHPPYVPRTATAPLFIVGAVIFIAINRNLLIDYSTVFALTEWLLLGLLILAWWFAYTTIRDAPAKFRATHLITTDADQDQEPHPDQEPHRRDR